ncbi:biotin--[acetyl-CoA-carboxylase] ligase [Salisediminibacterium halotolerans]|uniref:biotin--[acetyl-CoA-carboxylase] ligase n=1 Tax=Salisediminibacterium halotolerans TaxID=517425 RepID=UPI000EABC449|nr:biotin--[acetyl-CoA-carboxylase] ligase [Salisediminibacterium halotolerans]RLJ77915.1 BirA family biotin operon repressor/biotin-[acetyl-CoA-carboxylase] ligase [Actinophytocola xinjiangensis]RPE88747.1 BirA family biotin operon repressor/biotin-[acetyl-CoA-carboxylase] ligase [Salisediminibacterium halotolerans]TWG36892.1 BirA family biotin operon repressor/biotin-[acetyl-CoA-carboxylase] ligase [Salisediminibacterium halotolerans]GEL07422.1 bifunctional ligase/repressor BirA [Salisedimini
MRTSILQLLRENQNEFLSGEWLSSQLGCSRTAVWKHIQTLLDRGYEIEAVRNKGYRLKVFSDAFTEDAVIGQIRAVWPDAAVEFYSSASSTQTLAHRLLETMTAERGIVIADEQTNGKGRLGRSFSSQKGEGIWVSIVMRPNIPVHQMPQLTLVTATAVCKAVREQTGIELTIKWPNDLLLNGKKCCGILTEVQSDPDQVKSMIVGIGLNVNNNDFPEWLFDKATSLSMETGERFDRLQLLSALIHSMETMFSLYEEKGFSVIKPIWEASAESPGANIRARTRERVYEGINRGIDDDGVLLIEKENGEIERLLSADIEKIPDKS